MWPFWNALTVVAEPSRLLGPLYTPFDDFLTPEKVPFTPVCLVHMLLAVFHDTVISLLYSDLFQNYISKLLAVFHNAVITLLHSDLPDDHNSKLRS